MTEPTAAAPLASARRILALLFAANLLIYVTRYLLAGLLPLVERAFAGTTKTQLGALASIFVAAYLVAAPLFGALADRLPRRWLLLGGAAVSAVATALAAPVRSLGQFFATRVLLGVGQSAFVTVAPTVLVDAYPPTRRAGALGVLTMAQPVGTALSYLSTGLLVGFGFGWRTAFWLLAIPALLTALALRWLPEPPRGVNDQLTAREGQAGAPSWRDYLQLARTPSYLLDTLAMSANSFAMGGLAYWMPTFLHKERGVALATADIAFGLITAAAGAAGTLGGGALTDRLGIRHPTAAAWVAGVSALIAVPLFYLFFAVRTPWLVWTVMGTAEFFLFVVPGPANTILFNVTPSSMRGMASALNIVAIHLLGEMLSPAIIGLFADRADMTGGIEIAAWAIGLSGALWLTVLPFLRRDMALAPR